jgi:predicted DNA-binding WGR domain protein
MAIEQYQVHLVRIDQARNMARFYQLSVEPSLFGDYSVVRNWGRLGTRGHFRIALFQNRKSALRHFLNIAKEKKGRGYVPRTLEMPGDCIISSSASGIFAGSNDEKR